MFLIRPFQSLWVDGLIYPQSVSLKIYNQIVGRIIK
jgi:hypothetical protein